MIKLAHMLYIFLKDQLHSLCVVSPMHHRLFLTMDPTYGELSHAMRNRGIELYICPPEVRTDTHSQRQRLQ